MQFIDTMVEDLALMQRQDSTIQSAQHHVQNIHEEVEVPVFMRREPLRTLMVRATSEIGHEDSDELNEDTDERKFVRRTRRRT